MKLISEQVQGKAKPPKCGGSLKGPTSMLRSHFDKRTHQRVIPEIPPQGKAVFDLGFDLFARPTAVKQNPEKMQAAIQDRFLLGCKKGTVNFDDIVAAASLLKKLKENENDFRMYSRSARMYSRSGKVSVVSELAVFYMISFFWCILGREYDRRHHVWSWCK